MISDLDVERDPVFERLLHVKSLNFVGRFSMSPDGRRAIAWYDGDGSRSGARDSGHGTFVVIAEHHVVRSSRALERPNDGKISNDGTIVLNDWLFSDVLGGMFHVFDPDGRPRIVRRVAANLYNNGLSEDGRFACYQACHAPDGDDGSMLVLFDVKADREIARFRPPTGWAHCYRFEPDTSRLWLQYKDGSEFGYSFDGVFLDEARWRQWRLMHGDYYAVMDEIRSMAVGVELPWPAAVADKVLTAASRAAGICTASPATVAKAWKYAGMAAQSLGNAQLAREYFERAMKLNPRAGVKKLLAKL